MSKHTPGPWAVNRYITSGNQSLGFHIAAAPELLEALKKAVNRQGFTNAELITARAVIAKAEGNS